MRDGGAQVSIESVESLDNTDDLPYIASDNEFDEFENVHRYENEMGVDRVQAECEESAGAEDTAISDACLQ